MDKISDYNLLDLSRISVHGVDMFITKRFQLHYGNDNYESLSADIFSRFAKHDSVVIDIGAHYGYYSLLAAKKGATVFSFEPVKENFEILNKNIAINNFNTVIQSHNVALSNASGEKTFNIAEASDSSSFHDHPLTHTIEKRMIKTTSLDSFFTDQKIDLVKIDTEGHEIEVLEGMKDTITRNPDIKLLIEFNPKCLRSAGKNPSDMLVWLSQRGFDIFFIQDTENKIFKLGDDIDKWKEIIPPMGYVNILCVKKETTHFISFISHSVGMAGAERSLLELIDGLKVRGMICHVVLPGEGPIEEELKKRLITYDILPYRFWTMGEHEDVRDIDMIITEQSLALAALLDLVNSDIVYTNTSVINVGALAAKILSKPHVWHIREFGELDHNMKFTLPIRERSKFVYDHSVRVIYNSKAVEKYYLGDVKKSDVVYNNVNVDKIHNINEQIFIRPGSYKLAVMGTAHSGKNQEDAIWAVQDLVKSGVNVELVIVGDGERTYVEKLKNIVFENELEDYVRFLGVVKNPYSILSKIDVLIVCAKNEAFGRTIVEAMLLQKPVIAPRSGGVPEIITDGINGLLYASGNFKELAEKLKFLWNNKEEGFLYAKNAYAFAREHFSDKKYSGKITNIISHIGDVVSSSLHSLYTRVWKFQSSALHKKNYEIFDLMQDLHKKNQDISRLDHKIREDAEIYKTETTALSSQIAHMEQSERVLDAEKKTLAQQLVDQRNKFFEEYKIVQSELVSAVGTINNQNRTLREKESSISSLRASVEDRDMHHALKDRELEKLREIISNLSLEIRSMQGSKFWKIRSLYMRSKWALFHPVKFIKKYFYTFFPFLRKKNVALYIASNGNYFFREILSFVQEGFLELGYDVVVKDEYDEFGGNFDWHVVVAPHEFFYLGTGWVARDGVWPSRTIIINLEQPNLPWFEKVEHCMHKAYAIWDINYESSLILAKKHPRVSFFPLGYSKSTEKLNTVLHLPKNQTTEMLDASSMVGNFRDVPFSRRPIDICFIGGLSDRRDVFFARYGSFFTKYNCYFYFWNVQQPSITGTNTSMDTLTAQGIIQRSKILINIHQGDHPYFEWHRIVNQGIANKTLIISEICTNGDEFNPGEDFIASNLDDIPRLIEYYLDSAHHAYAQNIIDAGYKKFKTRYGMKNSIEKTLKNMSA